MASRINEIRTKATTQGFDKAAKDVNKLNQAQERTTRSSQNLGKASAASGRQFAAQASGLGGFVAAYAGAAANIFAVQQAFSALSRAAQVETTIRGTRTLAAEIGLSGDAIISKLQEVTQGQLTAAEAAQNANIALSAGFNTDQIEQLTEVATKASKALGRNLTESIQRVFRGAIKLEPELLDEIGIFTRIEPAVEKYAASLNRSVGSLTEFERRQAFANAVAEEGQRKFNEIDLSSRSAQKSLEQLSAKFLDLATKIGISIANFIEPFVAFLSKDFGNTLLVLGGIFTLVFRGAAQQVAQFTQSSVVGLNKALGTLESFSRKLGGTSEQFAATTAKATEAAGGFVGQGGFAGRREIAGEATKAKQAVLSGSIGSVAEAKAARDALKAQIAEERAFQVAVRASNRTLEQKNIALEKSRGRTRALTQTVRELTLAEQQAGIASRFLAKSTKVASVAVTAFGTAVGFALSKLNLLFFAVTTIQSILQFFGIDAIGSVVNWFSKLGEEQRMIEKGFKGLVSAVTDVSQSMIELAGLEEAADYADLVNTAIKSVSTTTVDNIEIMNEWEAMLLKTVAVPVDEQIKELTGRMRQLREEMDTGTGDIAKQTLAYNALKDALKIVSSGLGEFSFQISRGAENTGLSEKAFAAAIIKIKDAGRLSREASGEILILGESIGQVGQDGVARFTEFGEVVFDSEAKLANLKTTYDDAFNAGTITAEKSAKTLLGYKNILKELEEAQKAAGGQNKALAESILFLTYRIQTQSKETEKLLAAEKNLKTFRESFSKEIRAVDTAIAQGVLGIDGSLAKNAAEQQANRVKYLQQTIDAFNTLNDEQKKGKNLNGDTVNIYQAGIAALKAQAGIIIQLPAKLEKIRLIEEKRAIQMKQQIDALKLQNKLIAVNALVSQNKLEKELLDVRIQRINREKISLELQKARNQAGVKELEQYKNLLQLDQERESLQSKLARAQLEGTQITSELDDQKALLNARIEVEKAATSTSQNQFNARMKLLEVENQNNLNDIERRRAIAQFEYDVKKVELSNRMEMLQAEKDINDEKIAALRKENNFEYNKIILPLQELEDKKRANERRALELQISVLNTQEKINLAKIEADKDNRLAELKLVEANYSLLKGEIELAKSYLEGRKKLIEAESDIINGLLKAIGIIKEVELPDIGKISLDIGGQSLDEYIKDAKDGIMDTYKLQVKNSKAQSEITRDELNKKISLYDEVTALIEKERDLQNQLRSEKNQAAINDIKNANDLIVKKLANIAIEQDIEKQLFDNIIKNLDKEAALELLNHEEKVRQLKEEFDLITNIANDLKSSISGTLTGSVNDFFKAINEGTLTTKTFREGVKTLFVNLLLDIQQAFIDNLINEPIKDLVISYVDKAKDKFTTALIKSKSEDGSATKTQALQSGAAGDGQRGVKEIGAEINSGVSGIMENVKGTTIAAFAGVLAATGDFKKAIIAAFLEMFIRIMAQKAAASFGFAGGGKVDPYGGIMRFAKGGPVNTLRDRVPALLEPGEFVIRKPAAKAIGGSALNQLNATGKMNGQTPPVTVNVQNNGTAQQVESSTVRNDMGQLIIDLVVKDIENNGKVRKAMRGR
jgi:hypothetical protein